jgi:hypothetical protein
MRKVIIPALLILLPTAMVRAEEGKPLTPAEAIKKVEEKVTVEMKVRAAKDRLEKRGEIYLDSEEDFKDEKNLGVVITRAGAKALKKAGIAAPADHFMNRTIRVTGTVIIKEERPRIEIDEAKQIKVIEKR